MHNTPHSLPTKHFGDSTCICSCMEGHHSDQVRRTIPASQTSLFCQDLKRDVEPFVTQGFKEHFFFFFKYKIYTMSFLFLRSWLALFLRSIFFCSFLCFLVRAVTETLPLREWYNTRNTYSNLQDDINWILIGILLHDLNTKNTIMNKMWCRKVKNRVGLSLKFQCLFF